MVKSELGNCHFQTCRCEAEAGQQAHGEHNRKITLPVIAISSYTDALEHTYTPVDTD